MEQQNKMGTAKMGPLIFSMALPAMISMIINALYNIVDSIFVAKYSQDALAAVSLVYPLEMLVVAIGVGTGVGVNSLIARRLGERRQEAADLAAEHGVALSVIGGIAFFIIGWGLSGAFVGAFGASEAVSTNAVQYSHIAVGMSIFVLISMMCEKIQQSGGNMIIPMCQGLAGAIINIILDPLMIFGIGPFPRMEIAGAALATGIGQVITLLVYLIYYVADPLPVKLHKKYLRPEGDICSKTYGIGIPATLNMALPSLLISALNGILAAYSGAYVLVLGVYYKLQTFIYLPSNGIIQGIRPLIGYYYGAGERNRVEQIYRLTLELTAGIMAIGTALCWLIPGGLIGLFTENPETVTIGITALHIISLGFILSAVSVTSSGALEALGQGMASLVISVMRYVAVIIPAAFVLSRLIGVTGVWWAFVCTESVTAMVAYVLYRKVWKRA